jgi:hypothetical protein
LKVERDMIKKGYIVCFDRFLQFSFSPNLSLAGDAPFPIGIPIFRFHLRVTRRTLLKKEIIMDFVRIANFNNKLEAETAGHLLDGEDIPFLIHSDESIFGEGGVTAYVFLSVPETDREKALALIDGALGHPESL